MAPVSDAAPSSLIQPCTACRAALQVEERIVVVHGTIHSFLASVRQNCHFCRSLFHQLPGTHQETLTSFYRQQQQQHPPDRSPSTPSTPSRNIYKIHRADESSFSMTQDLLVPYEHHSAEQPRATKVVTFQRAYLDLPRAYGSLRGSFVFNLFLLSPDEWRAHCAVWNQEIVRAGRAGECPLPDMVAANPWVQLWPLPEEMVSVARQSSDGEGAGGEEEQQQQQQKYIPGVVTSSSTHSDETFAKIARWLATCARDHKTCRQRREEQEELGWLPTRLIKVEKARVRTRTVDDNDDDDDDDDDDDKSASPEKDNVSSSSHQLMHCRIVETEKNAKEWLQRRDDGGATASSTAYITLSHRWPADHPDRVAKLSTDNLEAWKIQLPLEKLSQTFRGAFDVALRLGISYIWIDSLCIIQEGAGAKADWEFEAGRMEKVYSHAQFNIYAARGKPNDDDTLDGLFVQRDPSQLVLHRAWLDLDGMPSAPVAAPPWHDDKTGSLRPFKHLHSRHVLAIPGVNTPGELWQAKIDSSPLAARGWIFQEQLLSRANLHFSRDEVLFECREMRASEVLGTEDDYALHVHSWGSGGDKPKLPLNAADGEESFGPGGPIQCWQKLLAEFSGRKLSYPTDRLVAMSGVAQHFKGRVLDGDGYLAGLWRSRLAVELLWRLAKGAAPKDMFEGLARHWRKPVRQLSFSWISVLTPIEQPIMFPVWYGYIADVECIRYRTWSALDNVECAVPAEEPFLGDIFSLQPAPPAIELRITGHLRQISLVSPSPSSQGLEPLPDHLVAEDQVCLILGQYASMPTGGLQIKGDTRLDFGVKYQDLTALNEAGVLFVIPLTSKDEVTCRTWLLLLVVVDRAMGRFRRIGVHERGIWPEGQEEELAEWLFAEGPPPNWEGPWTALNDLPCGHYDQVEKKHSIFLI